MYDTREILVRGTQLKTNASLASFKSRETSSRLTNLWKYFVPFIYKIRWMLRLWHKFFWSSSLGHEFGQEDLGFLLTKATLSVRISAYEWTPRFLKDSIRTCIAAAHPKGKQKLSPMKPLVFTEACRYYYTSCHHFDSRLVDFYDSKGRCNKSVIQWKCRVQPIHRSDCLFSALDSI